MGVAYDVCQVRRLVGDGDRLVIGRAGSPSRDDSVIATAQARNDLTILSLAKKVTDSIWNSSGVRPIAAPFAGTVKLLLDSGE